VVFRFRGGRLAGKTERAHVGDHLDSRVVGERFAGVKARKNRDFRPSYAAEQLLEFLQGRFRVECRRCRRQTRPGGRQFRAFVQRRRKRQKLFGLTSQPYPEYYTPKPYSKSFVLHLDMWYAQSHPSEDFAETFAVWLTPDSDWRVRFHDWPALKKLEYMDELMRGVAGQPPVIKSRRRVELIDHKRSTLRRHYDAVDQHTAGIDQTLGLAAAAQAARGHQLGDPFHRNAIS
jgi:hypothetical protein